MTEADRRSSARKRQDDLWNLWEVHLREFLFWLVCIAGVIKEVFFSKEPNLPLITALIGAIGIPFVMRRDEKARHDGGGSND